MRYDATTHAELATRVEQLQTELDTVGTIG